MAEDNKSVNLQWIQAFNERDWATEASYRTADFRAYMSGSAGPLDADGWKGFLGAFTTAFPDAGIIVEASLEEYDLVASRWTITGTHQGNFQGVAPTGRRVSISGIDFSRIADGRIAEHWAQFDLIGLMQQLGALPAHG